MGKTVIYVDLIFKMYLWMKLKNQNGLNTLLLVTYFTTYKTNGKGLYNHDLMLTSRNSFYLEHGIMAWKPFKC